MKVLCRDNRIDSNICSSIGDEYDGVISRPTFIESICGKKRISDICSRESWKLLLDRVSRDILYDIDNGSSIIREWRKYECFSCENDKPELVIAFVFEKGDKYFFRSFETTRRDIIREHGFRYIEHKSDALIGIHGLFLRFCIARY